jgi:carbamoyltransferase
MRKILGISAYYHDSAAAIIVDGEIVAAVQEERFTRDKHTAAFPKNAILYCLEESGLSLDELDAIVFYDKPLLKFERLLQTYYSFSPRGLVSFLKAIPVWIKEKMFLKKQIYSGLAEIGVFDKKKVPLLFPEHHLSHAASAFYPSRFDEAAVLTIDGVGEWCTASIGKCTGNKIEFLKELEFPHSVGLLYSAFTYYLGFVVNSGEYKLMGLAPYGQANDQQTTRFIELIKKELVDIKEDGSIWLNQKYFNYATGLRMVHDQKWFELFGVKRRDEEDDVTQTHCNLALAIQTVTEEIVVKMAQEAKRITGSRNLCMAGGVALNCVANGKLQKLNLFDEIYVQPASGDAGGALGAALAVHFLYFNEDRKTTEAYDSMKGAYLGPEYSSKETQIMNKRTKAVSKEFADFADVTQIVAQDLANGQIVGWFQGRMEFGPRSLGNRSILADARNPEMQKKINLKIKYREGFRPFAPSVLAQDLQTFFDFDVPSPYMLMVAPVKEGIRKELPQNYDSLSLWDRLYTERSSLQSITHLDFSARIQTVHRETNPKYHDLLTSFKEITGTGVLVNTSFNVRGEPVVCSPLDAYRCFMSTDMDVLVIGNFVYYKEQQPDWQNKEKWMVEFKKD